MYAGINLIVLDLSVATMNRSAIWQVGSLTVTNSDQPVSTGVSQLSNSSILLGLIDLQFVNPTDQLSITALSFPITFQNPPTFANLSAIQVQSVQCPTQYPLFLLEQTCCYDACPDGYLED